MSLRGLLLSLMSPSRRAAVEADSRAWKASCPHCGLTTSIWDLGGLRSKAAGRPVTSRRCRGCGKIGAHRLARSP